MADDHALYLAGHTSLRKQLLRECEEMAEYALNTGRRVPGATLQVIQDAITANESGAPIASDELRKLGVAHDSLSKLVLPATPYCLVLMDDDSKQGGRLGFLGPVPLVRRIMVVAIVSLIAFVWLSTSKDVTPDYADKIGGALHGSGVALLLNELFYMSAAALGGSFTLLFQMNQYIVQRNYDPKYEASYWIKLVLGVIAGLFVVTLVPLSAENSFAAPTLAMLGGFSASAVYRILNRLVQTMESMVQGDAKEMLANREAAAKLRATDEIAQNRMKLAANLVTLQQQLTAGGDSEEVKARLDHILRSLVPESADDLPPPAPARPAAPAAEAQPAPAAQAPAPAVVGLPAPEAPAAAAEDAAEVPAAVGAPDVEDMSDEGPADTVPMQGIPIVGASEAVG